MGCIVQGHMFRTDVRLTGTELTFMSLPELSGAHLNALGVFINHADHVSRWKPGCDAVSAHGPGPQYPHRVTHRELMRCRLQGGPGSHGVLLLELLPQLQVSCCAKNSLATIAMPSPDKKNARPRWSLPKGI